MANKNNNQSEFKQQSVSLTDIDTKIVEQVQQDNGDVNFSAALRIIIRGYPALKAGAQVAQLQAHKLHKDTHPSE
ncbi:MAG: hypothetical protein DWQ07_13960 [Chloroflexi bacterium]|nr:MAG: hypothetical protein DWQ07_13960 [Chloroflexota bacterium]